jgi:hypothetical protein
MPGPVLILAHGWDLAARALAGAFPPGDATLVTPARLGAQGWSLALRAGSLSASPPQAPRAIVTLLPAVTPEDLPQIDPGDRDYVAAEMTAFLLAWLHASPARKLNPPSFSALNGDLHPLAWRALAIDAGLRAPRFEPQAEEPMAARRLTLIGATTIGEDASAQAAARAMAAASRLPMLALDIDPEDGCFVGAGGVPDVASPGVAAAIRTWCAT